MFLKGIIHSKTKMHSLYTHSQVVKDEFHSSFKLQIIYFEDSWIHVMDPLTSIVGKINTLEVNGYRAPVFNIISKKIKLVWNKSKVSK